MKSRILILTAILFSLATTGISVFAQEDLICGSVEKFAQTKRWEDLPGCAKYENYEDANKTRMILAKTTKKFERFFTDWIVEDEFGTRSSGIPWTYRQEIQNFIDDADRARWQSDAELIAARPAFDEMKAIVDQHMALQPHFALIKDVGQNFITAKPQIDQMAGKGVNEAGYDANFATMFVKGLEESVTKAVAAGVPDSTIITSYKKKTYSLGDVRAETSRIVSARSTAVDKFAAAEEAKWRPFKSVLKGDRLAHFDRYKDSYEFRGVGGRILRTPADFRTTPIMAVLSVDDNGVVNRWSVTIWRFAGDKLVGKQTKTGWGSSAPSSAYR